MEEELNEQEWEERLYAMIHHVDHSQKSSTDSQPNDVEQFTYKIPRSTVRRYWHVESEEPNASQKVNSAKNPAPASKSASTPVKTTPTSAKSTPTATLVSPIEETAPKEEKSPKPPSPVDLSIFQSPVPEKKTIEILEHEVSEPVVLESSDEDEVVEVALPPKPTITIESSDEDESHIVKPNSDQKLCEKADSKLNANDRAVSASPVPSVVSSVSDEFIRSDCIALNISSRHPDKQSFDFSLHGADLLGGNVNTPSKKKKKKKNKEAVTSTPVTVTESKVTNVGDACFATPKSKAKNKKQKSKLFNENSEVYDSDSNITSPADKNRSPYSVTEKSLPSVDVYESDSNQSGIVKVTTDQSKDKYVAETYNSDSSDNTPTETPVRAVNSKKPAHQPDSSAETVDLTGNDTFITLDDTYNDSIVIGNVTGFTESSDYGDKENIPSPGDISKYVSSKVPSILNDDLDFDNLKGKDKVCKKRRYSLTTLRAEMEKFYNESWGGEDFNHKEILKNMSRDKSLWAIDPKDKMPSYSQRKSRCNYCNRIGHRDESCRQKPPVCYMCGTQGHFETRCPSKICVNCGSPNFMYSTMCSNCSGWARVRCAECGQSGHPHTHCPDLWRRYHNTTTLEETLEQCTQSKRPNQQYCSGCARRGHLVHNCRVTIPFSGLPIFSPYVSVYRPLYSPAPALQRSKSFSEDLSRSNKRLSKSPTAHNTHDNKKRNMSVDDSHIPTPKSLSKVDNKNKRKSLELPTVAEKTPDSSNRDNKGRVIQDNEVSDTSDVVTSSRIFVTNDVLAKLKTKEGEQWLRETTAKHNVTVTPADLSSYLNIKGKLAEQELFQTELREWVQSNTGTATNNTDGDKQNPDTQGSNNMPKNRNNLLRQINKALELLKLDYGDPMDLYKELVYSQNNLEKLKRQKFVSTKKLSNSRTHINDVLKKLNIILLGQAGLGDGSQHLSELVSFQRRLARSHDKNISQELRRQIGEHYHSIFSPTARNDYTVLMRKYYDAEAAAPGAKRNRRAGPQNRPSVPAQESEGVIATPQPVPGPLKVKRDETNFLPRLIFLRERLRAMRHHPATSRDELTQLQRRLQQSISMLYQNKSINSKATKKVKKLNTNIQSYLSRMGVL